ncbi:hypothetical protein Tco_0485193 [Tanacetum coccineum]
MKEQKQVSCGPVYDRLPALSAKYQWFVAKSPEDDQEGTKDQFFYNIQDPLSCYHCRIPELLGKRIRGTFHGWRSCNQTHAVAGRPDPPSHRDTAFSTVFLHKVDMTSIDWAKLEGLKRLDLTGKTPEEWRRKSLTI